MVEAALALAAGLAIGFAIAWALGGRTREALASTQARAAEQERAAEEKLALLTDAKSQLSDAFKALSAEVLTSSSQSFLALATESLGKFQARAQGDIEARQKAVDALVQPIRESLTKVGDKLGDLELKRERAYAAVHEQLRGLVETSLPQLRHETASLVKALRQPAVRGRWGEVQLQRVVQMAGMLEHCDFVQQHTLEGEDGRLRPDVIVKLAGERSIVIDAKVPIAAYLEAAEAADDDARAAHLARHAQAVRAHVTALGRRAYWDALEKSPDFVILFLPGEAFFSAALQQDPTLIEAGVNEKVLLATPTTLIALLRTVALGWREHALELNAQEVAKLGRDLYERVSNLAGHWADVGDKLGKAVSSYNKSVGTLESRVLVTARKFVELKAAPADAELPDVEPIEAQPRQLEAPELAGSDAGAQTVPA